LSPLTEIFKQSTVTVRYNVYIIQPSEDRTEYLAIKIHKTLIIAHDYASILHFLVPFYAVDYGKVR